MYNTYKSFPSNGCDYNNKKLHNLSNFHSKTQHMNGHSIHICNSMTNHPDLLRIKII